MRHDTSGVEAAGAVEVLGHGVDPNLLARRVAVPMFAVGRYAGGYAEYLVVKAHRVLENRLTTGKG